MITIVETTLYLDSKTSDEFDASLAKEIEQITKLPCKILKYYDDSQVPVCINALNTWFLNNRKITSFPALVLTAENRRSSFIQGDEILTKLPSYFSS